jgi:integrase
MSELAKNLRPSSLWSKLSMIKTCLSLKENINIDSFPKTTAFVKRQNIGYKPKKSKTLTMEQVTKFINEAPDELWLLAKTVLIFGIFGACRRDDLVNLTVDDIKDNGSFLVVYVRNGKTHIPRTFTITDDGCSFKPCCIYRKYLKLRPKHVTSRRFFLNYRNGKCINANVGVNTMAAIPSKVAKFLNLPNPTEYTGHCFRRTSATMLAEGGADILTLKKHGGWRSSTVAEGYVDQSERRKVEISRLLFNKDTTNISVNPINVNHQEITPTSTEVQQSTETTTNQAGSGAVNNTSTTMSLCQKDLLNKAINISNNTNCTFTINIGKI